VLYEADHPGNRARKCADEIRANDLAIWLDAGSCDALNAHDGAEFLHRTLWDLDIRHEYHLLRDADHIGTTLLPRIEQAFAFVGQHLSRQAPGKDANEVALRSMLEPLKDRALREDPTLARCYGLLR
jgi:S-formylglutathione hydrolase